MMYVFIGFMIICIVTMFVCLILMYKGKYNPNDDLDDVDIDIILNNSNIGNDYSETNEDNFDSTKDDL